jgi:hypothetical protein
MPRGGARPGTGGARPGAGRPRKTPITEMPPRPRFETAREFAVWALNAGEDEVSMDQKVRTMQAMLAAEGKQAAAKEKPTAQADDAADVYAPRKVRTFGVVNGDRR